MWQSFAQHLHQGEGDSNCKAPYKSKNHPGTWLRPVGRRWDIKRGSVQAASIWLPEPPYPKCGVFELGGALLQFLHTPATAIHAMRHHCQGLFPVLSLFPLLFFQNRLMLWFWGGERWETSEWWGQIFHNQSHIMGMDRWNGTECLVMRATRLRFSDLFLNLSAAFFLYLNYSITCHCRVIVTLPFLSYP